MLDRSSGCMSKVSRYVHNTLGGGGPPATILIRTGGGGRRAGYPEVCYVGYNQQT
jgi:hypothetical protein